MEAESSESETPDLGERKKSRAARLVKIINFVVPAAGGILVALLILRAGRPFPDRSTYVVWLAGAVLLSVIASTIVGLLLQRLMPLTRLFEMSSDFDEELHSRFKSTLRAGNLKTQLKSGQIELSKVEQLEHVMRLMDRMNRHERMTRGHSERVRAYSALIGEELGMEGERLDRLSWSALLHDVGKLDVPKSILTSAGKPTMAQWAVLKRHPSYAHPYLQPLESWLGDSAYQAAAFHHERWDGDGYPRGAAGDMIPLIGRIVSVADAFDVMTHARSYKKPLPIAEAKEKLKEGAGTQFDPSVVAAFLRIGDPRLRAVRGWAATVAGLAVTAESNLVTIGAQVIVATTAVAATIAVTEPPPPITIPPAVAFEEPTTTTTSVAAPVSTDQASTSTTTTTTTIATTTTTEKPIELMSIGYSIKTIDQEGVASTVSGDRLDVFVDDAANQTVTLEPDQRNVTVVIDVTDLAPGVHFIRFDLFDGAELVSSETIPISK